MIFEGCYWNEWTVAKILNILQFTEEFKHRLDTVCDTQDHPHPSKCPAVPPGQEAKESERQTPIWAPLKVAAAALQGLPRRGTVEYWSTGRGSPGFQPYQIFTENHVLHPTFSHPVLPTTLQPISNFKYLSAWNTWCSGFLNWSLADVATIQKRPPVSLSNLPQK